MVLTRSRERGPRHDGGALLIFNVLFCAQRFHVDWPTPPPGHAELTALIRKISSNGGFHAECDLVPLSTLQEQTHAFLARTWIFGTLGTVSKGQWHAFLVTPV